MAFPLLKDAEWMDTSDFLCLSIWFVKQVLRMVNGPLQVISCISLMLIYSSTMWMVLCSRAALWTMLSAHDDAAMWTMFLVRLLAVVGAGWVLLHRCLCRFCCEAFYVAEASVAAHGFEFDYCALEWACEGRVGLATNGLYWLFATKDSFEISGTSLADRC
ncbi:hypothetical protein Nepgr_033793 [Nepenthes gracilis]|uniref:Uncharacterized protein n=1 Tax=Nepenthes gracilis TaxID=150966 RepID=A0AAD3Y8Y6_NEPGR|nr:hypothetical protein Nepgr_033793 [Nepenthes gracilis]